MNFNNVGEAIMIVFDELQNDKQSSSIIDLIDSGETNVEIKEGLRKGVIRLRELKKNDIANKVESKMKGL